MKRWRGVALLAAAWLAWSAPARADDVLLKAMRDELQRSMHELHLPGSPAPYWMAYRVRANQTWTLTSSFGALTGDQRVAVRMGSVEVRVGSYRLDNGASDFNMGFPISLDDDYLPLRRQFWYLTDQSYKRALTMFTRKEQQAKQRQTPSKTADFTSAKAVNDVEPVPPVAFNAEHWSGVLRQVSARFRHYPGVRSSGVSLQQTVSTRYLVTSDGTLVRQPKETAHLSIVARTRATDGHTVELTDSILVHDDSELPDERALTTRVDRLVGRVMALAHAPTQGRYLGPVLLTGAAAPQFLAQILAPRLSGEPTMMGDESDLGDRLQHRILPTSLDAVDDPTLSTWQGHDLFGTYAVDAEGVQGQRVVVVRNGRLKGLLMGRRPGPEEHVSNGHARSATMVGFSNLIFLAKHGDSVAELKQKLRQECRRQGLPYGLMVVELEQGDFNMMSGLLASQGMLPLTNSPPVLVYRIDTKTGGESPVRTGAMDEVNLRTLRDIMAVGDDTQTSDTPGNALAGTPSATVVAPSLLLEELDMKPYSPGSTVPPVLTNPYFDQ